MFIKSEAVHVPKVILKYFPEMLGGVNLFNHNKGWIITSDEYEAEKALDPMITITSSDHLNLPNL